MTDRHKEITLTLPVVYIDFNNVRLYTLAERYPNLKPDDVVILYQGGDPLDHCFGVVDFIHTASDGTQLIYFVADWSSYGLLDPSLFSDD